MEKLIKKPNKIGTYIKPIDNITMNNETYFTYDVTIRSVSLENAGKCESVTGQMPAYIQSK